MTGLELTLIFIVGVICPTWALMAVLVSMGHVLAGVCLGIFRFVVLLIQEDSRK